MRQRVWGEASAEQRARFLSDPRFATPIGVRAVNVGKALLGLGIMPHVSPVEALKLRARGLMIRVLGRVTPEFERFVASRNGMRRSA
ncbi:hypothetical protein D3C87_2035660 [compost metagenome]